MLKVQRIMKNNTSAIVRIKQDAYITQGVFHGNWPFCIPPNNNIDEIHTARKNNNPDMEFNATWTNDVNGGWWKCVAEGYGLGDGVGFIRVEGWNSVKIVSLSELPEKTKPCFLFHKWRKYNKNIKYLTYYVCNKCGSRKVKKHSGIPTLVNKRWLQGKTDIL